MFDIELKPFNPDWALNFKKEARKVKELLKEEAVAIIHIGSTSVEKMEANEVIDMAVCVADLDKKLHYLAILRAINYRDIGYFNQEQWFIFGRNDSKYHIHLGAYQQSEIIDLLLFKLYLEKFDDYKECYINLKKKILKLSEKSLYEVNKQNFVFKVVSLAKQAFLNGEFKEKDLELIYKNGFIEDKTKLTGAILSCCRESEKKLKEQLPRYKELHQTTLEEAEKELMNSPFLVKFTLKNLKGEPVELEGNEYLKNMMADSLLRHSGRFGKQE
jgi:GrpB-like predicted nucleotidyltransferase (UPF0157 family)